jgi:hypothetical protein
MTKAQVLYYIIAVALIMLSAFLYTSVAQAPTHVVSPQPAAAS